MIWGIPRGPLLLGLAGLLPFIWGVLTMWSVPAMELTVSLIGPRFIGPYVGLNYGQIILAFMSGVLWGFATQGRSVLPYILSVIPALWTFFMVGGGPVSAGINLIVGFVGLLLLDYAFWQQKLAPVWWVKLRVMLTFGVVLCLLPIVF